jgi:CHAT domain-containing protein
VRLADTVRGAETRSGLPESHALASPSTKIEDHLEHLQRLSTNEERQRYFSAYRSFLNRSAVETLAARATSLLRVDPRDAENLIGTAFWLAEELDDDFARGKASRAYANLVHLRGDQSEALVHYALAKEYFSRTGAELEAAITASSSLHALVFQGKLDHALKESEFARRIFERHGDRLRLARLNFNYATLLYRRDQWAEAARYNEAAYRDFLEVGSKQDVAVCLGNMAVCHQHQHDFAQALAFYKKTRTYCEENGLTALTADLDYNIAYLHYLRGQYTTALGLYRETRARHAELGDKHHIDLCAMNEAEIYLELNLTGECADLAKAAYAGFRDRGLVLESAKSLTILAIAESRQGQIFLALELLSQAQELFRQLKHQAAAATIDLQRATLYSRAGRLIESRRLAASAESTFHRFGLATRAAACQILLGRLSVEQRDWNGARTSSQRALALLHDMEAPALRFQAHYLLGEAERLAGNSSIALESFLQAHEMLERVTGSIQTEDQRIPTIDDRLVLYESLVDLLAERQKVGGDERARAFGFVEKAKSRSLTDLLAFRAYALPATQPGRSKLADQVRQLREELNWYYRQIDLQEMRTDDRSTNDVEALRRYSRQQESRLIRTLSLLQETDKEFSSVQEAFSVDIEALRSSLPQHTTLLEYYVSKGTVFALVVDQEQIQVVPTTLAATVADIWHATAAEFSRVTPVSATAKRRAASWGHLEAFYSELIEPVQDAIHGDRLLVVPHGSLFYLPFHAFRVGGEFLSDLYPVSYAPSATAYYLTRVREAARPHQDGVVFLPSEPDQDMTRLAACIGAAMPGVSMFTGLDACEDRLKSNRTRSRIIHLLTRGQLRGDNPMFSTIQLGTNSVHFFDLYQLKLDADLVAISGCSPSLEADAKGNEIVGLVRGLLYSGARCVLTTLWEVDTPTWVAFAEVFYPVLAQGRSAEAALQAARVSLRQSQADPRYWAPFALFGDPQ